MPEIQLTRGKVALVDEEDFTALSIHKWMATEKRGKFYAVRYVGGRESHRPVYMARVIVGAGPDEQTDHINGDTLDNRRANLRRCSRRQNCWNRHSRISASGLLGVHLIRRKHRLRRPWVACINVEGRSRHLGYYATAEAAALAYDAAARELRGEFANGNF
jgi:hypothetical protein